MLQLYTKLGHNFPLGAFFAMLQLYWNVARNARPFRGLPNMLHHFPLTCFKLYIKPNSHSVVAIVGYDLKTHQKHYLAIQYILYSSTITIRPLNGLHQSNVSTHFSNCTAPTSEVRIRMEIQTNTTTYTVNILLRYSTQPRD